MFKIKAVYNTHNSLYYLHRIDGPSVYYCNGERAWYYKNQYIIANNQKEFEKKIKLLAII
jgi:hypothetical protein